MTSTDLDTQHVGIMHAGKIPLTYLAKRGILSAIGQQVDGHGPVVPPDQRVLFCDISKWNGRVNFEIMKAAGAEGVYMRASMGTMYPDPEFLASRVRVENVLPFGAYHALTVGDGAQQGHNFCTMLGDDPGLFPRVIDVELLSVGANIVRACVQHVYNVYQEWPWIYTSVNYWPLVVGETDKRWIEERCGLWVAHWGTFSPLIPFKWLYRKLHQYSADGNKRGPEFGAPLGAEPDMDLSYMTRALYQTFLPAQSWEHEIDAWARTQGYNGPPPD